MAGYYPLDTDHRHLHPRLSLIVWSYEPDTMVLPSGKYRGRMLQRPVLSQCCHVSCEPHSMHVHVHVQRGQTFAAKEGHFHRERLPLLTNRRTRSAQRTAHAAFHTCHEHHFISRNMQQQREPGGSQALCARADYGATLVVPAWCRVGHHTRK